MRCAFKQVAQGVLGQYVPMVQTSIEQFRERNEILVSIEVKTIVCLYIDTKGELLAHWLDDGWNFRFPAEQIIADLNEELPHMLHPFAALSGDLIIVVGELADDKGNLLQAYRCACNAEHVRSISA